MYQGKWRLLSIEMVRRWWLRRITYRPDYVGFNRGLTSVSRSWHFGLGLNEYVLYSILWSFGPIRCVYVAELVWGLFSRHQGALSSHSIYLDAEWYSTSGLVGLPLGPLATRAAQPDANRRQDTFPPWERFLVYIKYIIL